MILVERKIQMKEYTVYFYIKQNRTEYLADVVIKAENAKAACSVCKEWYRTKTGKNAFRPTTSENQISFDWYESRGQRVHFTA